MSDIRFEQVDDTEIYDVLRDDLLLGFFDLENQFIPFHEADYFTVDDLRAIADELDRRNGVKDDD